MADFGQGAALHIHHHRADLADLGEQILDGLHAVGGEVRVGAVRALLPSAGAWSPKQAFHFACWEAPLLPDLDAFQAPVLEHAVDGDAIYLENILYLAGCE